MTYFIPHLKKKMLRFLVLADFKLFSGQKIIVFFYQYPILSSLIYSYQIFNKSGLLPQDCLSSDYLLSDNYKSDLTALYLIIKNLVSPDATFPDQGLLLDWETGGQNQGCTLGGCNRIPGEENGDDTGYYNRDKKRQFSFWMWTKTLSSEVLFTSDGYKIKYVPGHFNQLRFNPKVASWSRHSRQKFYSPV